MKKQIIFAYLEIFFFHLNIFNLLDPGIWWLYAYRENDVFCFTWDVAGVGVGRQFTFDRHKWIVLAKGWDGFFNRTALLARKIDVYTENRRRVKPTQQTKQEEE